MITCLCAAPAYLQKCPGSTRDGYTQKLRPVDFKEMTTPHMLYVVARAGPMMGPGGTMGTRQHF